MVLLKNKNMITIKFIKELVEKKSGVYNLEQRKRSKEFAMTRYVCFQLSKKYINTSLSSIGLEFNRTHASVIHGLREFEILSSQAYFRSYYDLYLSTCKDIDKLIGVYGSEHVMMSTEEVKMEFRIKHIKLVEKSHEVIGSLTKKLQEFRRRPIFEEIALLSEEQLDEFELRTRAFLQMNKQK